MSDERWGAGFCVELGSQLIVSSHNYSYAIAHVLICTLKVYVSIFLVLTGDSPIVYVVQDLLDLLDLSSRYLKSTCCA